MKSVTILGSTGSVGRSTVDLIAAQPDSFSVQALTCHRNVDLLAQQAVALKARCAVVADSSLYNDLKDRLSGSGIDVAAGSEAVIEAAAQPADWTMAAIVGMTGLAPLMAAIECGGVVAIANKEPLVAAGPFVMAAARAAGATILPVDSEHNAVFQVFEDRNRLHIEKIILTASGGPFRTWTREQMAQATPAQAVAHPNWSMGAKISVDSATMMNKALEVIEAHHLFSLPPEKIEVMVHPQSLVHAMVEYSDGSVLTQMGAPDMRTPIAQTLAWPGRMNTTGRRIELSRSFTMEFMPPDKDKFPALPLAYECLGRGPAACVALNAANEEAVAAFLREEIGFLQIVDIVAEIVSAVRSQTLGGLADIIAFDNIIRERTRSSIMAAGNRSRISTSYTAAGT